MGWERGVEGSTSGRIGFPCRSASKQAGLYLLHFCGEGGEQGMGGRGWEEVLKGFDDAASHPLGLRFECG